MDTFFVVSETHTATIQRVTFAAPPSCVLLTNIAAGRIAMQQIVETKQFF